ncbi:hypothetical protein RhiirC2_791865 [Rhizophagus irregularis]|uniref:Crinkler effector protein N-terminal domain-containing protein n=1 Tax=Rhizophagus irregularis TaxID=588596 RepID=A0A2N1MIB7_9GLOM|nr:hypothetical protein RhiirC2_791865 [Rhizophagus irregularis]
MRLYSSWAINTEIQNMTDIMLTCRLFKDVEVNSKEFTVEVNTQDLILDLQEKIYSEVKKINGDFFKANELQLWKVEINNDDNDEFSSLVLPNDGAKNLDKFKEKIADYWDEEEKRLKEGCIHIIVNSPRVIKRRDKDEQIQDLSSHLQYVNLDSPREHDDKENIRFFTQLSDMLNEVKKNPRYYENTILQRAFRNGMIHEGDAVKYNTEVITTLRVEEGWAYINFEKTFHITVNTFLMKKLEVSYTSAFNTG